MPEQGTPRSELADVRVLDLPKIPDARGNLSFIESRRHVPFEIAGVYWVYDVPGGEVFSGRACRTAHEFVVALSGSVELVVDDVTSNRRIMLNRSYVGVHVPPGIWRSLENFSTNSLCMVLVSADPAGDGHIEDYSRYAEWRNR